MARAARTIDLGGRTVVPGLFDAHVHYTRAGVNPGYEARRIERAFSIAELQEAIAKRAASVPPGAFITCIGGWNHTQLAENRRPTKAELDAAAPKHGVYISGTGGGTGAITNSVGSAFFAARGVMVDEATGVVASAQAAVAALQAAQTARGQAARHRRSERACEQPGPDRRHQRRQSRRSGIRAHAVATGQAHRSACGRCSLPTRRRRSRRASSTTSARRARPSATTCSGRRDSASASAAPTRCRRSSSPPPG